MSFDNMKYRICLFDGNYLYMTNSNYGLRIFMFILLFVVLLTIFPRCILDAERITIYKVEEFATIRNSRTVQVAYDSLKVDVTWYTSSIRETDSTPLITADGSQVRNGIVAVSQNLLNCFEYGDSLYIKDWGWYEIRDCMHWRWIDAVDIWCDDRGQAIQNGRQKKWIRWNFKTESQFRKLEL